MLTPEQLEARRRSLGASEVAAIVGVDPFRTGLDIWLDKRGLVPSTEQSEAAMMGHLLEPVVATRYAMAHPTVSLRESGTLVGPESYFTATPDRIASTHTEQWLVEIKTKSRWSVERFGETGTDQVPPEILCQVLWQMAITGMDYCDVAVLVDGREYREYRVGHDREIAATLFDTARTWWQRHMVEGIEPPMTGSKAIPYLRSKFSEVEGEVIMAEAMDEELLANLAEARAHFAKAEALKEAAEAAVMARIGAAPGLVGANGKVSWRHQKGRTTVDYKNLVAELSVPDDVLQRYTRVGDPIRVFRFTGKKEE